MSVELNVDYILSLRNDPSKREELIKHLKNMSTYIREQIVKITGKAGGGHLGGSLSAVEMLVALYFYQLNIRTDEPKWEDRDRCIVSKGHASLVISPVLAKRGFFDESKLDDFNQTGSPFGMHPDQHKVPGIDHSTGSLGHGLAVSVGHALAARLRKKSYRVYCILSDGECNEGSNWEAAMSASHYKLGNLIGFVDYNKFTIDGPIKDIMNLEPFADKWRAFGWNVKEIEDGNDIEQILDALDNLPPYESDKPTMLICHTIKGKGVSWMENEKKWHYGGLDSEMEEKALEEIRKHYIEI